MSRVPARTPNTADIEAPAVLLPYQQRWMADKSPFKICEKSRRTGLTWAEAADDVLTAASARSAGGQNVYYIAYNKDMTIEYVQACAMWAKAFNHAAGIEEGFWDEDEADKHIKTFTIRFPASGFRIVALTSRPSNLRGRQGTIVIDEAAFHDKLDELLKAAMAMLIWGGRVRVISTHNGVDNPFNRLIGEIRSDSDRAGSLHRLTFQEAIADGLFRRVCLRSGTPWSEQAEADWSADVYRYYGAGAAEELDCIPSQSGGAYLTRALIESRMTRDAPVVKYTCPQGFEQRADTDREAHCRQWIEEHLAPLVEALPRHVCSSLGNDFARNGDLSVFVPLIELQQLERRCPFIVEMRNVPFKQQEQILFWLCDNLPRFTHGAFDARGNGQYLAEVAMQRYGAASITQIMLTANWYLENMPKLKAAFEDGTLESMPADSDTLDDLRSIRVVNGIPRIPEQKTKKGQDQRHGDVAVALCIAWYASRQGGGPIEYIPVPLRASDAPRKGFMRPDTSSDYFKPTWDSRRDW